MVKKIIVSFIILLSCGFIVIGIYGAYVLSSPLQATNQSSLKISIQEGIGVQGVNQILSQSIGFHHPNFFIAYITLRGWKSKILPGTYAIPRYSSMLQVASIITSGKPEPQEKTLKIIEGWTTRDMHQYLQNEGLSASVDFLANARVTDSRIILPNSPYPFFADKPESATLEGYLFPDTYQVFINAKSQDIIKKMLDNFNARIGIDLRNEIQKQNKTIFEVLTLASIVEKEGKTKQDRKMIADVFLKRLAVNMPLQSDATVNYATGKQLLQPSFDDVATDSLYNTYKYKGLPPGPICNPGLESIQATVYPTPNDYYYFLVAKDGTTIYSKTGEEHLANKKKYLD